MVLVLLVAAEMDPWSRECFAAYFACARLWFVKSMRTVVTSFEMKSEMGLPCDLHHELPEFDDPFAGWNAQDAQAAQEEEEEAAPVPLAALVMRMRRLRRKHLHTTASTTTMMRRRRRMRTTTSRRSRCCLSFPFWCLLPKGE
jgi:hypothetical protein